MSNNTNFDFVDYLDNYKSKRQCRYSEYIKIIGLINENYEYNNISHQNFTGEPAKSTNRKSNKNSYYMIHSNSNWNTLNNDDSQYDSFYSLWKSEHETDINKLLDETEKNDIVIEKVNIDTKIENLNDLIKIIDENEFKPYAEYNIDLKALHNIKKELNDLNNMIGMENMKKSILDQLLYFIQELHVGKQISEFKHTVIYGCPGTGKTEIAKIIGNMYSKLGILKNNVFKKVTRNDLIAGYLGQTAIKTKKVIDECLGGVLFIDEAYSLASTENNDTYSKECLDTLCEALSDHKDDLMVIIAGYDKELEDTFFRANRGLESRFIWRFKMDPYNHKEMMKIFIKKVLEHEWSLENENEINEKWFSEKKEIFKNYGRDMELLFTYTKIAHGRRIYGKDKELRKKISLLDINNGYDIFLKNRQKKENTFMHTIFI
jgi:SpoVK/Ycf46/Vps4 family AAA+-type ATPase